MTIGAWNLGTHALTGVAPHRHAGSTHRNIVRSWLLASLTVGACGVFLYGRAALVILIVSTLTAVACEGALAFVSPRPRSGRLPRATLIGLLLGLTLPANAPWETAVLGSIIAILVGRGIFGGFLHPALIGRVIVQFVFHHSLSLSMGMAVSPVLAPGYLLVGDIGRTESVEHHPSWLQTAGRKASELERSKTALELERPRERPREAYLFERPVQTLRRFAQAGISPDGNEVYEPLLRDELPPWQDQIFGAVPGGIGETCVVMLLVVGLYLIYRGYLRWQLPVAILGSAVVAAAILPVNIGGDYSWFPFVKFENGRAVGFAYVLHHLVAGQLMLGAFLLAGDVVASPMRVHGQIVFGVGIGVLTIFMRLYGVLEGECYWSILIMNALVGAINRGLKRPVLGIGTS